MNKLDQLPSELLSLILSHVNIKNLHTCTLINKSLSKVAVPLLWRNLDIWKTMYTLPKITTALTTSTNALGDYVRSAIFHNDNITDSDFLSFISHVPLLEDLQLRKAPKLNDDSFRWVARRCPRLKYLFLGHMNITKLSMVELGQYCHHLEAVKLVACKGGNETSFYVDFLTSIAACPLKDIELEPLLHKMTPEDVDNFASSIAFALHHHHRLTTIIIDHQSVIYDLTRFITTCNTHGLGWPHLTLFALRGCITLDDTQAIQFIQRYPRLQYLEFYDSRHVTDRTLDLIPHCLPDIIGVGVYNTPGITAMGVCRMVKQCASSGSLKEGMLCWGCHIYSTDKDFPSHLDDRFYSVGKGNFDKKELGWLDGSAFNEKKTI